MNVVADVRFGMVNELMDIFVHAFVGLQGIGVDVRSGLDILADLGLDVLLAAGGKDLHAGFPVPLQKTHHNRFVYAIAGTGLERGGPTDGEFLFLRAQSLPLPNFEHRMVCAAAAAKLARQQGQLDLAGKALDFLQGPFKDGSIELTAEQVAKVLETEKLDKTYPKTARQGRKYESMLGGSSLCPCPECRRKRGEGSEFFDESFSDFEDDEDDEDDEDEFDVDDLMNQLEIPEGFPPEIAKILLGEVARGVAAGESITEVLDRLGADMGVGSEKSRKGRRK